MLASLALHERPVLRPSVAGTTAPRPTRGRGGPDVLRELSMTTHEPTDGSIRFREARP